MINSSCFSGRALVYCHSQQCMVCAEGPMGVTSSPPRLLHHEDWDRWCSCQSWRGRTSGKCVDLKQFSRSSRCCGLMSTVQRCFLVWSLWGNWGGIATVSSWKCGPNALEDEEKAFGWPVKDCWYQRGHQHHGRLMLPLFHNYIWYLGSSRKVLVGLVFYFLAFSVSSVSPTLNKQCLV